MLVDEVEEFRVDLDHQIFSMPAPFPELYVVCAENGLGGKVLEHVLRNVVYADDELGDHRADDPFAALDRVLSATAAGRGRRDVPALARRGAARRRATAGCAAAS